MSASTARECYVACLFALLASNVLSLIAGVLGIHGIAFYHLQAIVACVVAAQLASLLLAGRVEPKVDRVLFSTIVIGLLYTFVSGLFLLRFNDVGVPYVALLLHTWMFYPATALLMLGCGQSENKALSEFKIPTWAAIGSAVVVLFGWVQAAVGNPIIEILNKNNDSKLVMSTTLGTFRPPSIFESSFQYGLFSVLVFAVGTGQWLGKRRGGIVFALIGASGVVISRTRNVYLCAVCTAISLWLLYRLRRTGRSRLLRIAPALYFTAAVAVMGYAVREFLRSGLEKSGDLSDASSTWARVSSWQVAWNTIVQPGSLFDFLFGYGITQAGHASDYRALYPLRGEGLFIDSTFINAFLFQGFIGLLLFLLTWYLAWRRLLQCCAVTWDPLLIGVTAFMSAFLAAGVFNILNGQWWGITLSLVLIVLSPRKEQAFAKSRAHYRSLPNCC